MVVKKYILNVDLMRRYSAVTPEFRRGDSGTLIFRVFNNGVEFDISRATKAEVYHETSMGTQIPSECTFTTLNGKRVIQYDYEKIIMVELGFTKTMLVIYEGDTAVSIIPFNVWIYSDMKGGANSYLELIQDLANQIEDLIMELNNVIRQSDKGKPNGVASLDGSGKIPLSQMPKEVDSYLKHMEETVYKDHSHGMKPDEDGLWMYKTANGDWQYFGFSDTAAGGGAPQVQLLEATIVVSNGIANVTYTGTPTVASSKWSTDTKDKAYFATNGTTFTGSSFAVSKLGMHTLFYRDSNGVEYVKPFNVEASMMPSADIKVNVEDGFVTVDIVGNVSIKKWDKGERNVSYFAYNGTTFTGNTFEVAEVGKYTIYYKLTSGLEYVYVFEVTESMLPKTLSIINVLNIRSNGNLDGKYRFIEFGIPSDSTIDRVYYSNYDTNISQSQSNTGFYQDGGFKVNTGGVYIDTTSNNLNVLAEFKDSNGKIINSVRIKSNSNYIYCEVDNSYIALVSVKTQTASYTVPTTINGLPVEDVGCIISYAYASLGEYIKVKNLTIPSSILRGGRFAYYTDTLESVTIMNPNFVINSEMYAVSNNTASFVVKAPNNSSIYKKLQSLGRNVQPL